MECSSISFGGANKNMDLCNLDDFRWIAKWNRPCHCVPWLSYHLGVGNFFLRPPLSAEGIPPNGG